MKKFCLVALFLGLAVLLCGCVPTREQLLLEGVAVVNFDAGEFAQQIEEEALWGRDSFEEDYYGSYRDVYTAVEGGLHALDRSGYVCGRFVQGVRVEYESHRGYVHAICAIEYRDRDILDAMERTGDALRISALSEEQMEEELMALMWDKKEQAVLLYESDGGDLDQRMHDTILAVEKVNYAFDMMLDSVEWYTTDYGDIVEAQIKLKYKEEAVPLRELVVVETPLELTNTLTEQWADDPQDGGFLLLQGLDPESDEVLGAINTAEINCALLPCEAEDIWHGEYTSEEGRQIVETWLEFPLNDAEFQRMQQELYAAAEAIAQEARDEGGGERAMYERIYLAVIAATEYDQEIYEATLDGDVTDQMQVDRTAYGALVNGSTVCTGYARAFKAICDLAGLPCWVITGTQDKVGHAWNAVLLDGDVRYVDCTFADTGGKTGAQLLFNQDKMEARGYKVDANLVMPW